MRGAPSPERARRRSARGAGRQRPAAGSGGHDPAPPRHSSPAEAAGSVLQALGHSASSGGPLKAHLGPDLVPALSRLDVHDLPHGDAPALPPPHPVLRGASHPLAALWAPGRCALPPSTLRRCVSPNGRRPARALRQRPPPAGTALEPTAARGHPLPHIGLGQGPLAPEVSLIPAVLSAQPVFGEDGHGAFTRRGILPLLCAGGQH